MKIDQSFKLQTVCSSDMMHVRFPTNKPNGAEHRSVSSMYYQVPWLVSSNAATITSKIVVDNSNCATLLATDRIYKTQIGTTDLDPK